MPAIRSSVCIYLYKIYIYYGLKSVLKRILKETERSNISMDTDRGVSLSEDWFLTQKRNCQALNWLDGIIVCKDCKHVSKDDKRYEQHFKEARHVNWFRNMAYRQPKKRTIWLRIWFSTFSRLEETNPFALCIDESEELLADNQTD
ncbi:uncharacterized protein LOC111700306 [Eurytemora carolleeae]|uniref:uncharacterized protein LOC111700306 n=1 Tax=Eurytemora carolleeae TaxID=1294199 RepID=UPI000C79388D|nr:uncharacterized protein LOC111700306 [Eurytemora carolleeae]|eukprot:XP_023326946.1 uncharacterized protein LOC111700306 [Eurytemora affinis]